jgi:hypothetical protein
MTGTAYLVPLLLIRLRDKWGANGHLYQGVASAEVLLW